MPWHRTDLTPGRRLALAAVPLVGLLAATAAVADGPEPSGPATSDTEEAVAAAGLEVREAPEPTPDDEPVVAVVAERSIDVRVADRGVYVDRDGNPLPAVDRAPSPGAEIDRPAPPPRVNADVTPKAQPEPEAKIEEPEPEPEPAPEPVPEPEPEPEDDESENDESDGSDDSAESEDETSSSTGDSVWDDLAMCESSGRWDLTEGLFEGGLQFHPDTWDAYKDSGMADAAYDASRTDQIRVAERVLDAQGWGAWPACSSELGLR